MSVTVVSTVGSASANSYVTVNECTAYWANRLGGDAWNDETDADTKAKAVISATSQLDEDDYVGTRVDSTQALRFPRAMVPKPDGLGTYYLTTEIPQPIKDATCELANELLASGSSGSGEAGALKEMKFGDVLTASFESSQPGSLPERISALLRGFKLNVSGVPLVRA